MPKNVRHAFFMLLTVTAVFLFGLLSAPVKAQSLPLSLTLQTPRTALPNQTITFIGQIVDPATDELFVNNIQFSLTGNANTFLIVNQASFNTFFANVPGLFFAGDDITTPVFSILTASNIPAGDYSGTVTLLGGADQNAQTAVSNAAPFTVRIAPASAPEPGTLALLGTLSLPVAGLLIRRRK
jgi:hypothetical protein